MVGENPGTDGPDFADIIKLGEKTGDIPSGSQAGPPTSFFSTAFHSKHPNGHNILAESDPEGK